MKPGAIQSIPFHRPELIFPPSAIQKIVGKKKIGEMTPEEYLRLAVESKKALNQRPNAQRKLG